MCQEIPFVSQGKDLLSGSAFGLEVHGTTGIKNIIISSTGRLQNLK